MKKSGECKGNLRSAQKIFRVMKMMCFLMFVLLVQVRGDVVAQNQVVSVDMKNCSVEEFLREIKEQTGIRFMYKSEYVKAIPRFDVRVEDREVMDLLEEVFAGKGIKCLYDNGVIILTKHAGKEERVTVKGVVKDSRGAALPGVTVVLKGTTTGVATGIAGDFVITLPKRDSLILVFSFVGMQTKEVRWRGEPELRVVLEDDVSEMDEVVVTGYQTITREKVTGAASTISARQLEERYTANILDNLEGRVAGLVTYGDKTMIRGTSSLYAETAPLLVVDGLPMEGKIEDLNPYDIESVTVLKDAAAAAIYGARASNGIIVITTKKAKQMGSTEIEFSGNLSIFEKKNLDYHDNFYMSPAEHVDVESDYWDYYFFRNRDEADPISSFASAYNKSSYITPIQHAYYQYATKQIDKAELESVKADLRKNNFAKEFEKHVLRRQFLQQYNLAFRTRTEKFNSNLVINYRRDNNGIVHSYDNQVNIAYRAFYDMKKWLSVNFGATGIISKIKESASEYATNPFEVPPYTRLLNDDGSYNYYSTGMFNHYYTKDDEDPALKTMNFNHLEELGYDQKITDRRNMRYQGELVFKIIDGLTVNTSFIYETERQNISNYSEADSYVMRMLRNYYTQGPGQYLIPENGGKLTTEDTRGDYWTARGQLNLQRTFAEKHAIDFLGGFEFRETRSKGTKNLLLGYDDMLQSHGAMTVDFPYLKNLYSANPYFANVYYGSAYYKYIGNAIDIVPEEHHRYASGYMNVTYTYDNRYNAFASFRKDYADLFGANAKFRGKPLWSVGASWNLNREAFMQDIVWLNNLKLRVSYGRTGNIYQGTTSYMTASTGTTNRYTKQPMAKVESPANPNLKWEKTSTINVGIDFSLFDHRLRGSVDWYNKKGSDIFSQKTLEPTKGFSSMNMNMADMTNNGVEMIVSSDLFRAKKEGGFTWTASLTASYNKNKITKMELQTMRAMELTSSGFKEGYPTSALFSYRYAGLNQEGVGERQDELGQPMYWTEDGRKVFSIDIQMEPTGALVYSGQSDPKVTLAMNNSFHYKGFSLNFMMVYYGGHKMRCRQYAPVWRLNPIYPMADYYLDAWSPTNTDTDVPGIGEWCYTATTTSVYLDTDIFVQPADFLKIRNLTLGYDVPREVVHAIGLNNLQVRFQIDNLPALWKKNKVGIDPETMGIRKQMTYVLGLNFNF